MRRLIWTVCAAIVFATGLALEADADSTLVFKAVAVRTRKGKVASARVLAGAKPVISISGYGWKSVGIAEEVARRLNALAEEGLQSKEISIWTERRTRSIVARGRNVITIDRAMAAAQGSSRASLARTWAEALRAQFGKPYLSVAPVLVPVGESRSTPVKGNIAGQLAVRMDSTVVSATWEAATKEIRVTGHAPGRAELIVEDRENALAVPVRAAKYAGYLGEVPLAGVTGSPAPQSMIARAAKAAAMAGMSLEPSAWANVTPWVKDTPALWPGKAVEVPTQLSAAGPDYLSYQARPVITVRNEPVSNGQAAVLMVSNSPERLSGHGLWFEGKIPGSQTARLLYHHVNAATAASDLVVEVWNLGSAMARVQVVGGNAGPSYDESYVGHRAALEFLANRAGNVGWIAPVPAGMAVPVVVQRLPQRAVVSGVLEFRPLVSSDLSLRLYLTPGATEHLPHPVGTYVESPLLGQWHYPEPRRELSARYEVGRDWAFVSIGDLPAAGLVEGDLLSGSYGVIYDIDLELVNPTAGPAQVGILLEPAGGPARGALLVDGRRVETALLKHDDEGLVARYALAPGETRRVRIETMPQGGSNYPVRLVARAI